MIGDEGRGRPRPSSFPVKDLRAAADREHMSTQISAPVKILALVGLLGSLAIGAWMFTAGRATTSASGDVATSMHADIAAAKSVAVKLDAHNKAATGTRIKTAVASEPVVHKAKRARVKAPDGTPTTIASALRRHRGAVVLLVDPQSKIDSYSVGEARRGASSPTRLPPRQRPEGTPGERVRRVVRRPVGPDAPLLRPTRTARADAPRLR